MRIIPKFAGGGGAAFPWVSYNGGTDVNNAPTVAGLDDDDDDTSSSSKSSSTSGLLTDKGLMDMVAKIDGLPSDMLALWALLLKFYTAKDMGLDTSSLSTQYIATLLKVKEAKYHKEVFDKAYENLNKNEGLTEYAVTNNGLLVSMDENNKLQYNSVDDVLAGKIKGLLLTNQDLLQTRAEYFSGKDLLSALAANGIGFNKVMDIIKERLFTLGSNEYSNEGKVSAKILEGAQLLQQLLLLGVDITQAASGGLYEAKIVTKELDSNIKAALNYIYNSLDSKSKAILDFHAGGSSNAKALISERLSAGNNTSVETKLDIVEDASGNKVGSSKSDSSEKSDLKTNPVLNILNGYGGNEGEFRLNAGTLAELTASGINYNSFVDTSGKTILDTSMSNMLADSGLLGIVDKTSVSFGNLLVTPELLNSIVYRNNGGTRVILPCKRENGKVVPNFDILDEYNQVILRVNAQCTESTPLEQRLAIEVKELQKAGLTELLTTDGLLDTNKVCPFLVADGYASDREVKIDDKNNLIQQVKDDKVYDEVDKILTGVDKKHESLDKDSWAPWDWFGLYDKLYSASVYIPIVSNNKLQAVTAYGKDVKYNVGMEQEANYLRFLKQKNIKNTSASVL